MPESIQREAQEVALESQTRVAVDRTLVAALRYRGDEVQWGRALTAVLPTSEVCTAFITALLGNVAASKAKRLLPIPADVVCLDENVLRGRPTKRLAAKSANSRVDLTFSSRSRPKWKLHVELKIDHVLTQAQVNTYADDAAVLAVVRDPTALRVAAGTKGWLGAVAWADLIEELRGLPVSGTDQPVWQQLLDAMIFDGDLLTEPVLTDDSRMAGRCLVERHPRSLITPRSGSRGRQGCQLQGCARWQGWVSQSRPLGSRGPNLASTLLTNAGGG